MALQGYMDEVLESQNKKNQLERVGFFICSGLKFRLTHI